MYPLSGRNRVVGGANPERYTAAHQTYRSPNGLSSRVSFGDFEADLRAGELWRSGTKIPLQRQPFQVLAALLERPGQLITRDELRQVVWGGNTFVDFERGLNKAINRLRAALRDAAENPAFIETLARRGYRFLGSVRRTIDSIAVLPFVNLSPNLHHDFWAESVTDELITRLAAIQSLRVISRTSCAQVKLGTMPLAEVARRLGVEAIVEGSVTVKGRAIRIRAQLIQAPQDRLLWAASYVRNLADVLKLQDQMVRDIAVQVGVRLASDAVYEPEKMATYRAYLRGRYFWNKRSPADLKKAIKHFQKAVTLDPKFAQAHIGLADGYVLLGILGLLPPHDVFPKARAAVAAALKLDQSLAEARATLGHILMAYDWDWGGAEREFKNALGLNPNCSAAHLWYGNLLTILRRHEEATDEVIKARDLDPLSISVNALLGFVYMRAHRYNLATRACKDAIELDPNNPFGHWILARVFDAQHELQKALIESRKAVDLSRSELPFFAHLGYALARRRKRGAARKIIMQLVKGSGKRYVSPYLIALIYTALDERDSAFKWLEKACSERTARLTELGDPPFDRLRPDHRFRKLAHRVGISDLASAQQPPS